MSDSNAKKKAFLDAMAGFVLKNGLNSASLRPLAKAAGTSDRMLIYHFGSKDGLIAALLAHLASQFTAALDGALPPGRAAGRQELYDAVMAFQRKAEVAAFGHVWLDILAEAGRGTPVFRETGAAIIEGFLAWISARLPEDDPDPAEGAAMILTLIEGSLVMDSVGRTDVAERGSRRLG